VSARANQPGTANPDAFRVGKLAERLAEYHYAYHAAFRLARDPRAAAFMPQVEPGQIVPEGRVPFAGGHGEQRYHFPHFLDLGARPEVIEEFDRTFYVGALLALGDALNGHGYFDHAPELELVYHMRNGVAHGNRFTFTGHGLRRLAKYPAHDRLSWSLSPTPLEVTPGLAGREVLFGFSGPAETHLVFSGASVYLIRMGNDDPLRG
jgi:hypothetical protein